MTISFGAALALASCSPSPYQTSPRANTNGGAALGAVIGGMAGTVANKHDPLLGAATGAALGAVVGGVIGSSIDKQSADLRSQLANTGVRVINHGNYMVLRTPANLLFATDSSRVSPAFYAELRTVAQSLIQYPNTVITVVGFTDNTGDAGYNLDLSRRRARSVRAILIRDGVAPRRIRAIGYGETHPIASNATAAGRRQNRRVEIVVRPIKQ